jgi:hypothetical protein
MNVIMLQKHEYPAHGEPDKRGKSVLSSGRNHIVGYVANLFVDEEERRVRFLTWCHKTGWGGKGSTTTT